MIPNPAHLQIPAFRQIYESELFRFESIKDQCESDIAQQLETALSDVENGMSKIFHPLFVDSWRSPRFIHYSLLPLKLIGIDIETNAKTGEPMLLGVWTQTYSHILHPTLREFFRCIKNLTDNGRYSAACVWGRLDIQAIIRLFEPTESERKYISAGFAGKWNRKHGWVKTPPCQRKIGQYEVFINQYIPGRSLQIGYIKNGRHFLIWIYNVTQFYQSSIKEATLGLGKTWIEYAKDTHVIDWQRFEIESEYRKLCLESNRQDAEMVRALADELQRRFNEVFECYPTLLVSTGSLTDAAISKMLTEDRDAYASINYKWIERNIFASNDASNLAQFESLLSECFSAGYVDQYAMGYAERIYMADIASAYPFQIRHLPDLRNARLIFGKDKHISNAISDCRNDNLQIESAIISGTVTIPETLRYHPITIKTVKRENIRPTGTFKAVYTLDEREFCAKYGATFEHEEYVILVLDKREPHPLAQVSERLGQMRAEILAELKTTNDENKKKLLDGMQYLVKVIDNSIYGKTVMTLETVSDVDGRPIITGYSTGDKFNLILGCLITARTRIKLAEACMSIAGNGGDPVLCMTDSVYWVGSPDALPTTFTREQKTPGYFELPKMYTKAFIVKTGQYEYYDTELKKNGEPKGWIYKLRGIPIQREIIGKDSLFRRNISEKMAGFSGTVEDFVIQIPIRKLVTIGSEDLESLALLEELDMDVQPFKLSSKSPERYVRRFRDTLTMLVPLASVRINSLRTRQLERLTLIYTSSIARYRAEHNPSVYDHKRKLEKTVYVLTRYAQTGKIPPPGRITNYGWDMLRGWYDDC